MDVTGNETNNNNVVDEIAALISGARRKKPKSRPVWDNNTHFVFLDLCLNEARLGNKPGSHFNMAGYENLINNLKDKTGRDFTRKQLKNHWENMKKDWKLYDRFIQSGVDASSEWWDDKIEANEDLAKFRGQNLEMYKMYYDPLFRDAVGDRSKLSQDYRLVDQDVQHHQEGKGDIDDMNAYADDDDDDDEVPLFPASSSSEQLNCIAKMASRLSSSSVGLEIELTKVGEKLLHLPSSTKDIFEILVRTEDILSKLPQSASIKMIKPLQPVIKALISEDLVRHSNMVVKISVAYCICEIMRITALDLPYNDNQMKEFFELVVTAFEQVSSSSAGCYTRMIKVLNAFSSGKFVAMMCALLLDGLIVRLFKRFLTVADSSSSAVVSKMEKIMTGIIKESKEVPRELVNLLATNGKSNMEVASPVCTQLAKKILKTYAEQLDPDIPNMTVRRCLHSESGKKSLASAETPMQSKSATTVNGKRKKQIQSAEYGENLVGHKIKVWWPEDNTYYEGIVKSFESRKKKHKVWYDDGDKELTDLKTQKWYLVEAASPMLDSPDDRKTTQPIRLESNLKKIADLNLDNNKVELMKDSGFGSLSSVTNNKDSSATLVAVLCSLYDRLKGVFQLNDETCFSFCSQEIAEVIGMQDSGINFRDYEQECRRDRSLPSGFPDYLMDLRDQFFDNAKSAPIKAAHIKKILTNMTVVDDESKLHFKQLMIYYLIEEVLLCGNDHKIPRKKRWRLVGNLEKCKSVNWAKAIDEHLRDAIVRCQEWLQDGVSREHCFAGATPVLEAILFQRIEKIQPNGTWQTESPPIQKYLSQRKHAQKFGDALRVLEAADILPCPHCTASSSSVTVNNTQDSGSPLAVTPEDSLARQLMFGDAKLVQAVPTDGSSNQYDVVQGYKVKNVNAPILEAIIKKHGDIAATCVFPDAALRTSLLDAVCQIVGRIETNDVISQMEEIESQLSAAEAAKMNVSWLRASLNAIHKRSEAEKSVTLLMEMKTNTILVKRAASYDLVAAEKQLAEAKRCVEVLDLVEKRVNKNFLEFKAERDMWAGHPII